LAELFFREVAMAEYLSWDDFRLFTAAHHRELSKARRDGKEEFNIVPLYPGEKNEDVLALSDDQFLERHVTFKIDSEKRARCADARSEAAVMRWVRAWRHN
jgi:hypothetical protein